MVRCIIVLSLLALCAVIAQVYGTTILFIGVIGGLSPGPFVKLRKLITEKLKIVLRSRV